MKINKQHIPIGKKRNGKMQVKTSITIHSTGNRKSTAQNERDYLTNPSNTSYTGFHYVVGEDKIIECIPPSEVAFHCGDYKGNYYSIGIEMIETGDREKVIDNTIMLVKKLQKTFNISDEEVKRHYDWNKKNCPRILNINGDWKEWEEFRNKLKGINTMNEKDIKDIISKEMKPSLNGDNGNWSLKHVESLREQGIDVYDERGNDLVTRGEMFALIDRVVKILKGN